MWLDLFMFKFFNRTVQTLQTEEDVVGTSYGERTSDNKIFSINREMYGAESADKIRFENKSGRTTQRTTFHFRSPATARPRRYSYAAPMQRLISNRFSVTSVNHICPIAPRSTCAGPHGILRICIYVTSCQQRWCWGGQNI